MVKRDLEAEEHIVICRFFVNEGGGGFVEERRFMAGRCQCFGCLYSTTTVSTEGGECRPVAAVAEGGGQGGEGGTGGWGRAGHIEQ